MASSSYSGSPSGSPATLPSDMIVFICRFFDSAVDVLSFALACKRHQQLLLSKIKEKDNQPAQALLKLHSRKVIGFNKVEGHPLYSVFVLQCLPNAIIHGEVVTGSTDAGKELMKLSEFEKKKLKITFTPKASARSVDLVPGSSYIVTAEKLKDAQKAVERMIVETEFFMNHGSREGRLVVYQVNYGSAPGSRKILTEENYKDGSLHGVYHHYDSNGNIIKERYYDNGVRDGTWRAYNNGVLKTRRLFKNQETFMQVEKYAPSGPPMVIMRYLSIVVHETRESIVEKWTPTGVRTGVMYLRNGVINGVQEEWDQFGERTMTTPWKDGKKDGLETAWDRTNKIMAITNWKKSIQDGIMEKFDLESGIRLFHCEFKNGTKEGIVYEWDRSSGHLIFESTVRNSLLEGLSKQFDRETGKLHFNCTFKEGKKHGEEERWDLKSGLIRLRVNWFNNEKNGLCEAWDNITNVESTGIQTLRAFYKNNNLDGLSQRWDASTGIRILKCNYKNDFIDGTCEKWSGTTGFRTYFVTAVADLKNGPEEHFESDSGTRAFVKMWLGNQQNGMEEAWDPWTGIRTYLAFWQNGKCEWEERWDEFTGIRINLCFKMADKKHGPEVMWDKDTGKRESFLVWKHGKLLPTRWLGVNFVRYQIGHRMKQAHDMDLDNMSRKRKGKKKLKQSKKNIRRRAKFLSIADDNELREILDTLQSAPQQPQS